MYVDNDQLMKLLIFIQTINIYIQAMIDSFENKDCIFYGKFFYG